MSGALFGTDGIRGRAGEYPFDPDTMTALGAILVRLFRREGLPPRFIIGRDSRESSPSIESWIAEGITSEGGTLEYAGLIPTPGLAYLTKRGDFGAGVMVSASHNPYHDNGIKIFSSQGRKLSDAFEETIEAELGSAPYPKRASVATAPPAADPALQEKYIKHLAACFESELSEGAAARRASFHLLIDCAHGAASHTASDLFRRLGFDAHVIFNQPDGKNINRACGALHSEALARAAAKEGAQLAVALDGDADRALFVDSTGRLYDGDCILFLLALRLKRTGRLKQNTLVATVMSNLGLELALRREDIRLIRSGVGDRLVLEEMLRQGAVLGGEQSGHVILLEHATTGDGLLTALMVLAELLDKNTGLESALRGFEHYPQILRNIPVRRKPPIHTLPDLVSAIESAERKLADQGRVLVRYSGTENVCRIMLEGSSKEGIAEHAERIARAVQKACG